LQLQVVKFIWEHTENGKNFIKMKVGILSICVVLSDSNSSCINSHLVVPAFKEQQMSGAVDASKSCPSFSSFMSVRRRSGFRNVKLVIQTEHKSCETCSSLRAARDKCVVGDEWNKANQELRAHIEFQRRERMEELQRKEYALAHPDEVLYLTFDQTGSYYLPRHKFPFQSVCLFALSEYSSHTFTFFQPALPLIRSLCFRRPKRNWKFVLVALLM
jgi:hypothetical protein